VILSVLGPGANVAERGRRVANLRGRVRALQLELGRAAQIQAHSAHSAHALSRSVPAAVGAVGRGAEESRTLGRQRLHWRNMQVDPTSARAEREPASRTNEDELDEMVATVVAEDVVPDAVLQAARDAAGVPAEPELDDTIAAVRAEDAVPVAVVE